MTYILGRNILSQSYCSLCLYVCIGLPGPAHPHKVKYSLRSDKLHCLFPCSYEQRENISLWEGVLVLEGQYIHTSRESHSFGTEYFCPIHTYIRAKRERTSKPQIHCICSKQSQVNVHFFQPYFAIIFSSQNIQFRPSAKPFMFRNQLLSSLTSAASFYGPS